MVDNEPVGEIYSGDELSQRSAELRKRSEELSVDKISPEYRKELLKKEVGRVREEFEKKRYRAEARLDASFLAEKVCDSSGNLDEEKVKGLNDNFLYKLVSPVPGAASFEEFAGAKLEEEQFFTIDNRTASQRFIQLISGEYAGGEKDGQGVRYLRKKLVEITESQDLAQKREKIYKNASVQNSTRAAISTRITQVLREYYKQFEEIPELEVKEEIGLDGQRKLMITINRAAMYRLDMLKDPKIGQYLEALEKESGVVNPTIWFHLAIEENENAEKTLKKLPKLLQEAVVLYTGWYSTPEVLMQAVKVKDKEKGEEIEKKLCSFNGEECTLADVIQKASEGKTKAIIGVSGPGVVDPAGRGAPSFDREGKLDYGSEGHLKYLHNLLQALGVNPFLIVGHSRAGRDLLYGSQKYFLGIPCFALNPAALLAGSRFSGLGRLMKRGILMQGLEPLNKGFWGKLSALLGNIDTGVIPSELTSIVRMMIGEIPGEKGKKIARILTVASINNMRAGQARGDVSQANVIGILGRGEVLEEYFLTLAIIAMKDFFVNKKTFEIRQFAQYKKAIASFVEDFFNHRPAVFKQGKMVAVDKYDLNQALKALFDKQVKVLPDGHYNFMGEGNLELFKWVFKEAEKRIFCDSDFLLAAALSATPPMPVILKPCFEEALCPDPKALTNDILVRQTEKAALIVPVSAIQHERVRRLLGLLGKPAQSSWERYREKSRERVVKAMDLSAIKDEIRRQAIDHLIEENLDYRRVAMGSEEFAAAEQFTNSWDGQGLGGFRTNSRTMRRIVENAIKLTIQSNNETVDENHLGRYLSGAEGKKAVKKLCRVSGEFTRAGRPRAEAGIRALAVDYFIKKYSLAKFSEVLLINRKIWIDLVFSGIDLGVRDLILQTDPHLNHDSDDFSQKAFPVLCRRLYKKLRNNELFKLLNSSEINDFYRLVFESLKQEVRVFGETQNSQQQRFMKVRVQM